MPTSKITFKLISDTHIKIFNDGEEDGDIYSDKGGQGGKPYPHNEKERAVLESIQICGFTDASAIWPCGVFHGKKDMTLRFNKLQGEYCDIKRSEYKKYVDKCFALNKPQLIKSFNDWMFHLGYPEAHQIKPTIYDAEKKL